jgi:hypothetical protein
MKINFDKESNTITINDNIKKINYFYGILLIINILILGFNTFRHHSEEFIYWLWLITFLILVSGVIYRLLFVVFKTTNQSQIKVEEIEYVKIKKTFTLKSFYFSLKNGKRREVVVTLNPNDFATLIELCNNFGIEIRSNQNH